MRTTLLSSALALALTLSIHDAAACGGCFSPPPSAPTGADASTSQSPTVVTDHRMVLSMTSQGTTLWDQIEYGGDPSEFVWVLPIQGAAVVGVGSDAFVDALDQTTAPTILGPQVFCNAPPPPPSSGNMGGGGGSFGRSSSGCGCAGSAYQDDPVALAASADSGAGFGLQDTGLPDEGVTISHRESVGPYETVQITGDGGESVMTWLRKHGFDVPKEVEPMMQKYVDEKFGFLAVRLRPGVGVRAMKPIRVSWKGKIPSLPLRMVAAGVGSSVGLKLFVIGDGRWRTKNFDTFTIADAELTWDFSIARSTYTKIRDQRAAAKDGRAWILESSIDVAKAYLPFTDPEPDAGAADAASAKEDAHETAVDDAADAHETAADAKEAAEAASDGSDTGEASDGAAIDASDLPNISPTATDVDVAFFGASTRRVTRLRADLPARHLDVDLELEADVDQSVRPTQYHTAKWTQEDRLCAYGVAYVLPTSFKETPSAVATPPPVIAGACAVSEPKHALRAPLLGFGLLAMLGVGRRFLRGRAR